MEHAFERARASGKAEDDTRLRIFFVMALFAAGFITLQPGAPPRRPCSLAWRPTASTRPGAPNARADVVDRNGQILAMDLVHYGLYVNPREVSDAKGTPGGPAGGAAGDRRRRSWTRPWPATRPNTT